MNTIQDKASMAIRETANEWAARLAAPDVTQAQKAGFTAWLRTSPVHVREYLDVEAVRLTVGAALHDDATDVRALLGDTRSNVVELDTVPAAMAISRRRAPAYMNAAALAVLAIGAVAGLQLSGDPDSKLYSTGVGEIRRVPLPDGSIVELNTRSEIRIDFAANRRDIHLAQGEAFFDVAKDPARPFRVLSDAAQIRAIGTRFSVHRKTGHTVVTVVEGRVAASKDNETLELAAGHRAVIDVATATKPALPAQPELVDASRLTAWRQHRLIFDNQPLSEVVAEFNRYNRQQLVIEDAALGAQGISGVFDPDKPQGLVLFLDRKGGVRAVEGDGNTLLLVPRG
jgi:transmembrane sensor